MKIDHVGIATRDASDLTDLYRDLLGAAPAHEETLDDGLHVTFLDCGNAFLELLEPTDGGTVDRYLERNGPGIHHVAFQTPDARDALDTAREHGIELIDEEPREGAWGHEVAFLHPKDTGGVLVEFVEH